MLLNRLQMTITSIHICFQVSLPSACAVQKLNGSLPALQKKKTTLPSCRGNHAPAMRMVTLKG